jgi:hypothetical protein
VLGVLRAAAVLSLFSSSFYSVVRAGVGQGEVVIRMRTLENNTSAVALGFGSRPEFQAGDFLPAPASQSVASVAHSARLTMAPSVASTVTSHVQGLLPPSRQHSQHHSHSQHQEDSPRATASTSVAVGLDTDSSASNGTGAQSHNDSHSSASNSTAATPSVGSLPKAGDAHRAGRASINHLQALLNSAATITALSGSPQAKVIAAAGTGSSPRTGPPPPPPAHHH